MRFLLAATLLFLMPMVGFAEPLRTWTDSTGKRRISAELVAVEGEQVTLRRSDGKEVVIPLSRLSKPDRNFLAAHAASGKRPPVPVFEKFPRNEAVAKIQSFGGVVALAANGEVFSVDLGNREIPPGGLKYLASFPHLGMLNLTSAKGIADDDLAIIAALPELTRLSLNDVPLQGTCFVHIGKHPRLANLSLRCPGADATHLAQLSGLPALVQLEIGNLNGEVDLAALRDSKLLSELTVAMTEVKPGTLVELTQKPNLWRLWLSHCGLTDDDLSPLKDCHRLSSLWLHNSSYVPKVDRHRPTNDISEAGAAHLSAIASLADLSLARNPRVGDEAVKHLAKLSKLTQLELTGTAVLDNGLAPLAELPQLSSISLEDTQVTEAALPSLAKFPAIREVWLTEENFSAEALANFKQLKPKISIQ